jgi:hypothetical protein
MMALEIPRLRLDTVENTRAWGSYMQGWELVTVKAGPTERPFPASILGSLRYENTMARHGYYLSTQDVAKLLQVWAPFLRPGDELVVRSWKDRGTIPLDTPLEKVHSGADLVWGYKIVADDAGGARLDERCLAKAEAGGSNPLSRSATPGRGCGGAGVAQLVEREPSKLDVAGSMPVSRSRSVISSSIVF